MSDNEDLLGDDLGDQSLADYNLGNEEEEQLLADDYDSGPQNVPSSLGHRYEAEVPPEYPAHSMEYNQPIPYQPLVETECVVPNIIVEVPNPQPEHPHCNYAPYEPVYEPERTVPAAIPAAPIESPQIVPSELNPPIPNGDLGGRERFVSERPAGAQRLPQVRDIPDSLDKVVVPRGRGRGWTHRFKNRALHRANFFRGKVGVSPHQVRPGMPAIRPEPLPPAPDIAPDLPYRPHFPQFNYRPPMEERPPFLNVRPNLEPHHFPYRPFRPVGLAGPAGLAGPPGLAGPGLPDKPKEPEVRMLPVLPPHLPLPHLPPAGLAGKKVLINPHFKGNFQPPVEGLPAYIPTRIAKSPPISPTLESKFGPIKDIDDAAERFIAEQRNALARAANRKFTRRSPLRYIENTTIEIENELAVCSRRSEDEDLLRRQEEFINANRAGLRRRMRSPSPPPRRSPSPRLSPDRLDRADRTDRVDRPDRPDRTDRVDRERVDRRPRPDPPRHTYDEESEYKRRLREQESLRERVLRAKEVRRRKNAVALHNKLHDKEREQVDKEKNQEPAKPEEAKPAAVVSERPANSEPETKPDTTRMTPEKPAKLDRVEMPATSEKNEKVRERSPIRKEESSEVNSTCGDMSESLTPPRSAPGAAAAGAAGAAGAVGAALTPPLPDDDDLDLILGDIDGILSDDDDDSRFKITVDKPEPAPKSKPTVDLRSKLPPKSNSADNKKTQRQKIVFNDDDDKRKKEKTPPMRKPVVTSTKNNEQTTEKRLTPQRSVPAAPKNRQRIVFDKEEKQSAEVERKFSNRRVILQRKATKDKSTRDPAKPTLGIFTRAVRTAVNTQREPTTHSPQVSQERDPTTHSQEVSPQRSPRVELWSEEEGAAPADKRADTALVLNLPPGITDTRLKTLAGSNVQNLVLDKEDRSAMITFKNAASAENFRRKFNYKMVAASRLTVILR